MKGTELLRDHDGYRRGDIVSFKDIVGKWRLKYSYAMRNPAGDLIGCEWSAEAMDDAARRAAVMPGIDGNPADGVIIRYSERIRGIYDIFDFKTEVMHGRWQREAKLVRKA